MYFALSDILSPIKYTIFIHKNQLHLSLVKHEQLVLLMVLYKEECQAISEILNTSMCGEINQNILIVKLNTYTALVKNRYPLLLPRTELDRFREVLPDFIVKLQEVNVQMNMITPMEIQ